MKCKHKTIRVYEEVSYIGELRGKTVYYNPLAPEGVSVQEIICIDCDDTFDDLEAEEGENEVVKLLELAVIYLEDGARATAVDRIQAAIKLLKEV